MEIRRLGNIMPEFLNSAELDILALLIKGYNNKMIAREMNISICTAKAHLNEIYKKLKVHNRVLTAVYVVKQTI